jgi:vang-like
LIVDWYLWLFLLIPQDDNWGDNTTAVTGNTSDVGGSMEDVALKWNPIDVDTGLSFKCQRWGGYALAAVLSLVGILSPVVMVALPKAGVLQLSPEQLRCGAECDGALLSLACKIVILAVGSWAVFMRKPRATTPRIYTLRALVLLILFVLVFAYWLFYCVHLIEETDEITLYAVVLFAVSLSDSLLFVHYVAVVLMEIRQQQPQYVVKVRSPLWPLFFSWTMDMKLASFHCLLF